MTGRPTRSLRRGAALLAAARRDLADPERIRPELDSGDHLHPNDAGRGAGERDAAAPVPPSDTSAAGLAARRRPCMIGEFIDERG